MGWKIVFAPQALEELEQIVGFIAQEGLKQKATEFTNSGAEVYAKA